MWWKFLPGKTSPCEIASSGVTSFATSSTVSTGCALVDTTAASVAVVVSAIAIGAILYLVMNPPKLQWFEGRVVDEGSVFSGATATRRAVHKFSFLAPQEEPGYKDREYKY